MNDSVEQFGWKNGQTAEDFAQLVASGLAEGGHGSVVIPCEDYMFPDFVAMGGVLKYDGGQIPYGVLLTCALKDLQGLTVDSLQAVLTEHPAGSAYSMGIRVILASVQSED